MSMSRAMAASAMGLASDQRAIPDGQADSAALNACALAGNPLGAKDLRR